MSTSDSPNRYRNYSSEQLTELAAAGRESFTPDAWESLEAELEHRQIRLSDETETAPEYQTGIGGWLVLFLLLVIVRAGFLAIAARSYGRSDMMLLAGFHALGVLLNLYGIYLVAALRPAARRFWVPYLFIGAALDAICRLAGEPYRLQTAFGLSGFIWGLYWIYSRRVQSIFQSPAVEPPVAPAD